MTAAEDLLLRILGDPDEDLPRLQYADEIEEADPARAEFIRVQCELARMTPPSGWGRQRATLQKRERALLLDHAYDWFSVGILKAFPDRGEWSWQKMVANGNGTTLSGMFRPRRGFIESLDLPAADWLAHADQLLAAHPVQEVTLTTMPDIKNQIESMSRSHHDGLLLIRHTASWGGKKIEQELAINSEMMLADAITISIPVADFLRAIPEWKTVKTWHLPPQDRLGEMFRYVAGNLAAVGGQPPIERPSFAEEVQRLM